MPSDLPTELIDEIVGNLKDDHYSLTACSLVAHFWLPCARRVLFFSIHVRLHEHDRSLEPFIKLISSSYTISHAIRRLWIKGHFLRAGSSTRFLSDNDSITSNQLFSVLRLLPHLLILDLEKVGISHVVPIMAEEESPCPSMRAILLKGVPVNSLGIYVVIASLPHLEEIHIGYPQVSSTSTNDLEDGVEDPDVSQDNQVSSDHLFELPVVVPPGVDPAVLSSLRASVRLDNLYHFCLSWCGYSLSQKLLHEWALNVIYLSIEMDYLDYSELVTCLPKCKELRYVRITVFGFPSRRNEENPWTFFRFLIVNLPNKIKNIKFHLNLRHLSPGCIPEELFQVQNWSDAEENLAKMENLLRVRFNLDSSTEYRRPPNAYVMNEISEWYAISKLGDVIKGSLPLMEKRGLLKIREYYSR